MNSWSFCYRDLLITLSILSRTRVETVEDSYLLSSPSNSPTILSLFKRSFWRFYLNSSIWRLVFSFSLSCSFLILSLLACSIFLFFAIMPLFVAPESRPSSSSIRLSWILSSMTPLAFYLLEEPRLASAFKRLESSAIELVEFLSRERLFGVGFCFSLLNIISSWMDSPIEEPLLAKG